MTIENRVKEVLLSVGTDYKTVRSWMLGGPLATLASALQTTDKSSLAAAINEVNTKASAYNAPPDATTLVKGLVRLANASEMTNGMDQSAVATAAGVRQERLALKAELLGGADAAWDTLQELKTQILAAEETADINAILIQLGLKANSADVYTKAQVDAMLGNPDADFAAYYTAAKA